MSRKVIVDDDYEDIIIRERTGGLAHSEKISSSRDDKVPKGLEVHNDVIDEKASDELFEFLDGKKWKSLSDSKNSRKVQHYGYVYDYKSRSVSQKGEEIPDLFQPLIEYLINKTGISSFPEEKLAEQDSFNQVIVNNYEAGQGISAHTDVKDYGKVIACFTIGSGAMMRFTKDSSEYDLYVKANSVYIMSGESRYKWKHEMISRKSDVLDGKKIQRGRRISITFRTVEFKTV